MLNNNFITDLSNMYAYRAYLEQLINTTKDVQDTRLLTEGFVKDKHKTIATNTPSTANSRLAKRSELLKNGSIIELYGRLYLDIFQQGKHLPPGLDLSLKLIPSDDKFALLSSKDNALNKYEIVFAKLLVKTKQLNDALEAAQQAVVKEGTNIRVPYNRDYIKHYSIPTGLSTIAIDNVFTGVLPDLAVIQLVEEKALLGATKRTYLNSNLSDLIELNSVEIV